MCLGMGSHEWGLEDVCEGSQWLMWGFYYVVVKIYVNIKTGLKMACGDSEQIQSKFNKNYFCKIC